MDDDIDRMFDKEFSDLIVLTLEIGNSYNPGTNSDLIYASGLGKKIISHVVSAKHLYNGYELQIGQVKYEPKLTSHQYLYWLEQH